MNKALIPFVVLSFLLTLICCSGWNQNQSSYRNDLNSFPTFLVDHFPVNALTTSMTSKAVDTTNDCMFYLYYSFKNKDVSQIQKRFESHHYLAKYNSIDTSIITVKNASLFEWTDMEKVYYKSIFRVNKSPYYPILYFEDVKYLERIGLNPKLVFDSTSTSGLSKGFTIYVFDSKPGTYWKGAKDLDYMPDGWKRGFSKGACINEKEQVVIYWFVVW